MPEVFKVRTYNISGALRRVGESDDCITRLAHRDGLLSENFYKK